MRKQYSSYKTYKDSGVEWIGKIPVDWIIVKLKAGMKPVKEKAYQENPIILSLTSRGVVKRDTSSNEGQIAESYYEYNPVKKGDLLLNPMDLVSNAFSAVSEFDGVISQAYFNLRCLSGYCNKYYDYYFKLQYWSLAFHAHGKGVSFDHRWTLNSQTLMNYFIPYPSFLEQKQIVSFLDNKTKLIDELIEKTKQKIELLKEKRASLINHCVTKGLNPDVEMKDSKIEWIGKIPSHWKISKFKYDTITPVRYGINIESEKYAEEGIRFIRITDLDDWGRLNTENGKYLNESDVDNEFLLNKYDLLLCRSGHTVGKSYLHLFDGKYTSGGYLVRFNFGNYFSSKFIFYITKSHFYWNWIYINTIISTIENVNGEKYSNFEYPYPPIPEQQQIVEYLDSQTQKIDTLIEKENKRIELLKEYRQSLISEAVTGKIDMRDEVAV
jgi:type I restriction enzyme S subunit